MADNPQIRIGADMSGAEKAVEDFGKKLDAAAKPRKVDLDTSPAVKALDDLGKKGAATDKATGLPGAAHGIKSAADELKKLAKIQADLAKANVKATQDEVKAAKTKFAQWRDSGAAGTRWLKGMDLGDLAGGGWRKSAMNEKDALRRRNEVFKAIGLEVGGAPGDQPGGGRRSIADFIRSAAGKAGRGVAGQVLPNGGVGGAIAKEGVAEAAGAGGLLSGAGMARMAVGGLIGAAAFGAMKLVGGVMGKVGVAQDEGMNRSDLLRSVGGTVEEFNQLRQSAQALAQGLSVTAGEATSLARAYAAGSGVGQNDRGRIYGEAGQAGSFARQMGMDVGSTVGQFAELRRNGQDTPERLGKSIADAMSKRGDFGRLSEVLGNLTSFTSNVTGSSLTKANTGGVLDIASRLAALNMPGMGTAEGVGHAAAMDAGFRGGAGGEAGDLMIMQGIKRRGGNINGYDVKSIREAGLFANLSDVFGRDSAPYKEAASRGDQRGMDRYSALAKIPGSALDHMYADLKGQYGANSPEMVSALSNYTNGNQGDAYALMTALNKGPISGVTDKLKGMGIDTSNMNVSQMAQASGVVFSSPEERLKRKKEYLGRSGSDAVTGSDRSALEAAKTDPDIEKALAAIASKETIKTDGELTRASLNSIQVALESMASKVAGLLEPIRDALVKAAVWAGAINPDEADSLMGVTVDDKLQRDRGKLLSQREANKASAGTVDEFGRVSDDKAETEKRIAAQLAVIDAQVADRVAQKKAAAEKAVAVAPATEQEGVVTRAPVAEAGRKSAREPGAKDFALTPAEQAHSDAAEASTVDVDIASVRKELANQKEPEVRGLLQVELNKLLVKKRSQVAQSGDSMASKVIPGDAMPAASAGSAPGSTAPSVVHVEIVLKDPKGKVLSDPQRIALSDGRPTPNGVVPR